MNRRSFFKSLAAAGLVSVFPLRLAIPAQETLPESMTHRDRAPGKPFDIAGLPSGNLAVSYVALGPPDYKILITDLRGKIIRSFGEAGSKEGFLNFPRGIDTDSQGHIFVVDSNNCRIQRFSPQGEVMGTLGAVGAIGGTFATPQGVFIDDQGRLLVSDTRNHRVQIFKDNDLIAVLGELGDGEDQFRLPTATVVDSQGRILVLDSKHGQVKIFHKDFKFVKGISRQGDRPGELNLPQGMAIDSMDNLWIADTGNKRIQVFDPNGEFLEESGPDPSGQTWFDQPTGIEIMEDKVIVADYGRSLIKSFPMN